MTTQCGGYSSVLNSSVGNSAPARVLPRGGRTRKAHPAALAEVGYSVTTKLATRRRALGKAVHKFGSTSTFRKLRAVATFTKRSLKGKSERAKIRVNRFIEKMKADSDWVKQKYPQ